MTACTGLGVMPGSDVPAAADIIGSESAGVVHRPIQPARGLGADPVGRTCAMLVDLPVDRGPRSWRVSASAPAEHFSRAAIRARDVLAAEADGCEAVWGTNPAVVRLPVVGPWTLACAVELANGHRLLSDAGAVRYLAQSLAAGVQEVAADIARRHAAEVVVQLDEPQLARVSSNQVADAAHRPVLGSGGWRESAAILREVTSVLADAGIATTIRPGQPPTVLQQVPAPDPDAGSGPAPILPAKVIADSGVSALWVQAGELVGTEVLDAVGGLYSEGVDLEVGVVPPQPVSSDPTTGAWEVPDERVFARRLARIWDELGLPRTDLVDRVTITPQAGFARADDQYVAAALAATRRTAELIGRAAGDL
ncbi:hypothetical protein KRX51_04250 [Corynebacterium sp. TAE3-ERU12]|uniref:hypothetical protein n=1 Tax=Corynebacterium sp. TAE3-ERU12 TaxID=2849491 RepID=UPI001C469FBE|nr:hypothetical protein [Corynebacterium sp. TAE3-ERU12]MBV7295130.1 hypothetical protein [Corynebacterium sp. TAE3-ERU12]